MAGEWDPDTRVGDRYVIEERIGEGASAVTYRARDEVLGRPVALKVLRSRLARDSEVVARFEREARIAAAISHPNVVTVYDFGADAGAFYITLQFVAGRDLRDLLEERGRLPAAEAVALARAMLAGLGAIHLAGIVHRDVKPSNVLIGRDGVARLTDFGVAYEVVADRLTSHGTTVGTAAYMAPEQARGGDLTPATDLYAVGVVLFEMLTGHLPFAHDNPMATLLAQIQSPVPRPREVAPDAQIPSRLEAVVLRALAKDPIARYPSAAAMAVALAEAIGPSDRADVTTRVAVPPLATEPVSELPADAATAAMPRPVTRRDTRLQPTRTLPTPSRRRMLPWLIPLAAALAVLIVLAVVVLAEPGGNEPDDRPTIPAAGGAEPSATGQAGGIAPPTETAAATAPPTPTSPRQVILPSLPERTPTATAPPPPTATATSAPTGPPPPTETPVPTATTAPTSTAEPTATLPPTPSPTAVAVEEETPPVQPDENGGGGGDAGSAIPGAADTMTLPADAWVGGEFAEVVGRAATTLDGRGNDDEAAMTFHLDEVPPGGLVLRLTGFEQGPVPGAQVEIEVNDRVVWRGESPFAEGQGQEWVAVELPLLADDFAAGENVLVVRFDPPGGRAGNDALLALGEVSFLPVVTGDVSASPEESDSPATQTGLAGTGSAGSVPGSSGGDVDTSDGGTETGDPGTSPTIAPRG